MPSSVLIIHANTGLVEQLCSTLRDAGFACHGSACCLTALDTMRHASPGLVLLDAELLLAQPALISTLRASQSGNDLPIILLIPENCQDINRYLCAARVNDYIRLPFSAADLQARCLLRLAEANGKPVRSLPQIDYAFLAGLSKLAVADLETSEILQRVVEGISQVIEVRRCSITMIREDNAVGYVLASSDDIGVSGLRIDLAKYPEIMETISSGRPLLIENIRHHPLMENVLPYIEGLDFNSLLVLPMVDRQRTVGVLVLRAARSIVGFTMEEVSFCQLVANVATSALKMAELKQEEAERSRILTLAASDHQAGSSSRERSALLGMAAHDLRVLVSVVDGYCLLLSETGEGTLSVEQNEILNGLMTGSRRLVDMANNLLDYSRIEAGRFEMKMVKQDICRILKTVYSEIYPLLHKRSISMEVHCLDEELLVVCDEEAIRRVFYNIVSNALKFTPDGGEIRLSLVCSAEEARFSIEDNGPGIAPQILSHLFDEYVCSASPDGKSGNGLGLSICKKIIEAHQGRIWAESSLGQGSRFTFCLPK